jgi:(E)-4-hydroxy-3-methylbut-2-enyl-diphosphate synthase
LSERIEAHRGAPAGEAPGAPVFIDGKKAVTLRSPTVAADFKKLVIDYIESGMAPRERAGAAAE